MSTVLLLKAQTRNWGKMSFEDRDDLLCLRDRQLSPALSHQRPWDTEHACSSARTSRSHALAVVSAEAVKKRDGSEIMPRISAVCGVCEASDCNPYAVGGTTASLCLSHGSVLSSQLAPSRHARVGWRTASLCVRTSSCHSWSMPVRSPVNKWFESECTVLTGETWPFMAVSSVSFYACIRRECVRCVGTPAGTSDTRRYSCRSTKTQTCTYTHMQTHRHAAGAGTHTSKFHRATTPLWSPLHRRRR